MLALVIDNISTYNYSSIYNEELTGRLVDIEGTTHFNPFTSRTYYKASPYGSSHNSSYDHHYHYIEREDFVLIPEGTWLSSYLLIVKN